MRRKVCVAYDFKCYIETEERVKVTGSHVQCKSDSNSETVQSNEVVTTDH